MATRLEQVIVFVWGVVIFAIAAAVVVHFGGWITLAAGFAVYAVWFARDVGAALVAAERARNIREGV